VMSCRVVWRDVMWCFVVWQGKTREGKAWNGMARLKLSDSFDSLVYAKLDLARNSMVRFNRQ
jgi:hypothetical protein